MKWFYSVIGAITALCFVSCGKTVYVPLTQTRVERDTIVRTEKDSALLKALFECDSNRQVVLKALTELHSIGADQGLSIENGHIEVITRWNTHYVDRIIELRDTVTVVREVEVIKSIKHIPRIYKISLWILIAGLGLTIRHPLRFIKTFFVK